MDQQLLNEYMEKEQEFTAVVRGANAEKQELRAEIADLEAEMRTMRDALADKQSYNRGLNFILSKEE